MRLYRLLDICLLIVFHFHYLVVQVLFVELVCPEKSDRVVTSSKNLSPLLSIPSTSTLSSLSESITEVPDVSTPSLKLYLHFGLFRHLHFGLIEYVMT